MKTRKELAVLTNKLYDAHNAIQDAVLELEDMFDDIILLSKELKENTKDDVHN